MKEVTGDRRLDAVKVLMYTVGGTAVGFYRCIIPAIHINRRYDKGECNVRVMTLTGEYDAHDLSEFDVVILQRFTSAEIISAMNYAIRQHKKVVFEIDDYLLDIPDWNPASLVFRPKGLNVGRINEIMKLADCITTTVPKLAKFYKRMNDHIVVLPNYVDVSSFEQLEVDEVRRRENEIVILWQGSDSHAGDLNVIRTALVKIATKWKNVKIVFFGYMPDWAGDFDINRFEYFGPVPFWYYYNTLKRIKFDIGLCPIVEHKFNLAKSGLKALEYGMSNGAVIASNLEPYKFIQNEVDGLLVHNSTNKWYEAIERLIVDKNFRIQLRDRLHKRVIEQYDIAKHIHEWEELYTALAREPTKWDKFYQDEKGGETV